MKVYEICLTSIILCAAKFPTLTYGKDECTVDPIFKSRKLYIFLSLFKAVVRKVC